ncbi:unnamed protein product [Prorocentrum cordatum]|uniref:Transmembrane protein 138 n=1 Tax=Prorocentrum cordatum TaxID=2364126 RepID=A0ABN9W246_9DINO|nr:unnamed protein product [Polarella glacialis]
MLLHLVPRGGWRRPGPRARPPWSRSERLCVSLVLVIATDLPFSMLLTTLRRLVAFVVSLSMDLLSFSVRPLILVLLMYFLKGLRRTFSLSVTFLLPLSLSRSLPMVFLTSSVLPALCFWVVLPLFQLIFLRLWFNLSVPMREFALMPDLVIQFLTDLRGSLQATLRFNVAFLFPFGLRQFTSCLPRLGLPSQAAMALSRLPLASSPLACLVELSTKLLMQLVNRKMYSPDQSTWTLSMVGLFFQRSG